MAHPRNPHPPVATRELSGVKKSVAVFAFYLSLSVIFTAPVSLLPHRLAVNDGDPLHISWILAWDAHQIVRDPLHLFDSNAFHPYENSLAFSEHLLVPALLAAPFFYATGNALLAQNVAMVLTLALSAFAMFLLVREAFRREDAGLVAGTVYAFHTYFFHEVARLQLLSVQWWPLALLFLHRLFSRGERKNAFLFAFFFLLQGLSCTYYLVYFALGLLVWLPAYLFTSAEPIRRFRSLGLPLALVGLVFVVIGRPYGDMLRKFDYQRELVDGVDVIEYLRPREGSIFSSFVSFDFEPSIIPQFLGFATLGLALLGLFGSFGKEEKERRLFFRLSLATALLGAVLSLGPTIQLGGRELGPGFYGFLYEHLPLFQVLRNPERLSVLVHFGLAILAGVGAGALLSKVPRRWASRLLILLLVVLPLEHFNGGQPFTRLPTGDEVPEVYRWLGTSERTGPVVELPPYRRSELRLHALYMFYSTYHWRPIVFGRTSFYPPLTGYLAWEMRDFPAPDTLALLHRIGVSRIVVHPMLWPSGERGNKLARLGELADKLVPEGRFPPLSGQPFDRYGFGDERSYRLALDAPDPASPPCIPADEIDPADWKLEGDGVTPLEWAVDRNPATKWKTHGQLPGIKLEVDLGREETISAVRLAMGHPFDQFPRDVTLKVSSGERGAFDRVEHREDLATKLEVVDTLLQQPADAAITLRFPPVQARRLRVWIREGKEFDYSLPDWSLPEMYLYRSCVDRAPPS